MSLRDRIGKVIFDRSGLGDLYPQVDWSELSEGHRECYRRDADAILALPGIAVVELPEQTGHDGRVTEWKCGDTYVSADRYGIGISVGTAGDGTWASGTLSVDEARDLAASLLAAIRAVERKPDGTDG